jgi:hypothetical protein
MHSRFSSGGVGVSAVRHDGPCLAGREPKAGKANRRCGDLILGERGRCGAGKFRGDQGQILLCQIGPLDAARDRTCQKALSGTDAALHRLHSGISIHRLEIH